mmetsp:Transcript_29078/g.76745  ORF Transcript_29078/g.76745 Transcript_29078/m.76745 type:complete len:172 (-) Transcript_29078:64-579(-)|eukprot:CAMPEP_0194491210 /NCGR_PEP_ID=MMETSP0253-20130528/10167_1 /TAXON_ID=2966 /ORGANISM="Noctiluca scintillans" /LENGTH=171 /DNA_ID=CAMNT_0039331921 /DNA_START=15 /DNA_END=530 /DNA_ORIENTATION=-
MADMLLAAEASTNEPPDDMDPQTLQWSIEELQLESDIRKIEIDTAIAGLRRQLEVQERHLGEWQRAYQRRRSLSREMLFLGEDSDDDQRDDEKTALKADLKRAGTSVEALRDRLHHLEVGRVACVKPATHAGSKVDDPRLPTEGTARTGSAVLPSNPVPRPVNASAVVSHA